MNGFTYGNQMLDQMFRENNSGDVYYSSALCNDAEYSMSWRFVQVQCNGRSDTIVFQ